jgi:hypothetical protein
MGRQYLPQLDEGAHDGNVHLNGARTAQDTREHGYALLGECMDREWRVAHLPS